MSRVVIWTLPEEEFMRINSRIRENNLNWRVERDDYHLYKDKEEYKTIRKAKKIWYDWLHKFRNE